MKAVAVIGYKKTGKTTVASALIRELTKRGYTVAAIKHAHSGLTLPDTDSTKLHQAGAKRVVAISPEKTLDLNMAEKQLWEAITLLQGYDYLIVEGFKSKFPGYRIVTAKTLEDTKHFKGPLILAYSGPIASQKPKPQLDKPVIDALTEPEKLADLVEEKAFHIPPGLDCGFCKYKSCIGLATAIAKGEATIKECTVWASPISLEVDGQYIALNPFVQDVLANVLLGIIKTLKGVPQNPSQISLKFTPRNE